MFEIGDRVKWHRHGAAARGRVVRVADEEGEVDGFRSTVELEDGAQVAHREDALSPG